MTRRMTLASPAAVEGVGLFTERRARVTILPARHGGIVFCRADLASRPMIPAAIAELCTTPVHPAFARIPPRHTALAAAPDRPETAVYTTEHLLAALAGMGVTDALVELDAPELPIGDGSAKLFTDAIASAGLVTLPGHAEPIILTGPVAVTSPDGSATIAAEPLGAGETPSYAYTLDYGPNAPVKPQTALWRGDPGGFLAEIAPARTFSLAAEAAQMQALGLFRSFTPRDLLVIDDSGAPIDNALRYPDEPARHKLLDLIGDLALTGRPIHARIAATRAGHALNHQMARALLQSAR
ncbi:MAG: UDP-3-O-acyl-N-acetylglucosamine deacetylase [Phycisphaerales bacterium]|nr:UDP-3-O-acyl-N-acetylglucosamine deacetylase [Phycisphaerales bacterium]